jgi:CRISPR/Cas system-associated exonuclease Cas4 (RecB family)
MRLHEVPEHLSVTDLMNFSECPRKYYLTRVLNLPEPDMSEGESRPDDKDAVLRGLELGRIVHSCLEQIRYESNPGPEAARAVGSLNLSRRNAARVTELLQGFLTSDIGSEIRESRKVIREVPYTLFLSGVPLRGRVDLVYLRENGSRRLVDFKTNDRPPGDLDSLAEHYRLQMELYGLTLSREGNTIPADGIAYFLVPGEFRVFSYAPDVIDNCLRRVTEMVERIVAGSFDPPPGRNCRVCAFRGPYCNQISGNN